jgi:DNA-binding MarR family transcriptional regulator
MTAPPAVYGEFGMTLAFAERALTKTLLMHLAQRDTQPETWYALQLAAGRRGPLSRQAMIDDLAGGPSLNPQSAHDVVVRVEADGLITGDELVSLTPTGAELYQGLREHVLGGTARLLDQFDLRDIETMVRTLQAVTKRAEEEALAAAS